MGRDGLTQANPKKYAVRLVTVSSDPIAETAALCAMLVWELCMLFASRSFLVVVFPASLTDISRARERKRRRSETTSSSCRRHPASYLSRLTRSKKPSNRKAKQMGEAVSNSTTTRNGPSEKRSGLRLWPSTILHSAGPPGT